MTDNTNKFGKGAKKLELKKGTAHIFDLAAALGARGVGVVHNAEQSVGVVHNAEQNQK